MLERRAWRVDLAATALLAAGLLVALSVWSHDPADLPGSVYPVADTPRNVLGLPGARLALELLGALGVAVHVFLASWFVLVLMLFLRRRWLTWIPRLIGWLLLTLLVAAAADRWLITGPPISIHGNGGSIGAWLDARFTKRLAPRWQSLVLGTASAIALLLIGSSAIPTLVRGMGRFLLAAGRGGWTLVSLPFRVLFWMGRLVGKIRFRFRRRVVSIPPDAPTDSFVPPVQKERTATPTPTPSPAPSTGIRASLDIPVVHHGVNALTGLPREPDEPELEERAAGGPLAAGNLDLSNGLHSERERFAEYEAPPLHMLEDPKPFDHTMQEQQLRDKAVVLEKTFHDFGLTIKVVGINTGPVVTMYEVTLETGVRVAKVTSLADDLALHLKVPSVRMVTPLPGKNAIGIEIPNEHRAAVRLKEVIQTYTGSRASARLPLFLGKDAEGRPLVGDLADMPHLLIAGTTGTGKSVCLNAIILSVLMTRRPDEVRLILIDPKSVEMECYSRMPHLMCPIITDMKKAEAVLAWAVDKMEERYDLLRRARVRSIAAYNDLAPAEILRRINPIDDEERQRIPDRLGYIVIVIDEMADLMMQFKKEVEGYIIRLAQKSRAAGIHLVLATQKPTVDVITGLIKSNLPSRICFKVAQKSDSRVVLDVMGADRLLGKGDLLFLPPGSSDLIRAQGAFASDQEIQKVTDYLESDPCYEAELLQLKTKEVREAEESGGSLEERLRTRDKLYEQAVDVVVREGRGSVSLLQRSLGIGYGRAARLIDFMAQDGIVGNYNGSNAREVLYSPEEWANLRSGMTSGEEDAA